MDYRMLGPLQVTRNGLPVALGGAKQRTVLALLLLDAGRVVSVDRLVDALWGEQPPVRGAATLQVYVANLRKALEPDRAAGAPPSVLRTQAPGYLLDVEAQQVDLRRFETLAAEGRHALRSARPGPASVLLREALSLWRGRPLEDLPVDVFAPGELARLEGLRLDVLEDRVEADLATGRHGEVVAELEGLVARHPFRERLAGQWMLALYRCGRQAEALAAYQAIRATLVDELGIDPGAELQALEAAILQQDGRLAAPSAVPLDEADVARLLQAATGQPAAAEVVARITAETGGAAAAVERAVRDEAARAASALLEGSLAQAGTTSGELSRATAVAAEGVLALQRARRMDAVGTITRAVDPEGTPPAPVACPYKGLVRYEAEDAVWFHGRERLTAELLARLGVHRFVGVVGASGSGKSSLVRAGLLAAVREGALPGSERWPCVLLAPGRDPVDELARAVAPPCGLPVAAVKARLEQGAAAFGALLRDAVGEGPRRFVVLVDQLEEAFTLCADLDRRALFLHLLTAGVTDAESPLSVVVAVRADYYGRCGEDADLAALLTGSVLVSGMERDELRRSVEEPARIAGLALEAGLIERIVGDVADEPGALPLLSTALVGTWERRRGATLTVRGYDDAGGVRGALARHAEEAFSGLDEAQQPVARDIFLRLATPGVGHDDVRRRAPLDELVSDDTHADVLTALVERRLVVVGEQSAEVAHEALLREWPRLRDWLEDDRESRRVLRHLADAARDWDHAGRDPDLLDRGARLGAALDAAAAQPAQVNVVERDFLAASQTRQEDELLDARRTSRRLRVLAAGLAVVALVAAVAGVVALDQRQRADERAQAAEASRESAEASARAADANRLVSDGAAVAAADPVLGLLLAAQGVRLDDGPITERGLLEALGKTGALLGATQRFGTQPLAVAVSPDGSALAVSDGTEARVWDPKTSAPRGPVLRGASEPILGLAFVPARDQLFAFTASRLLVWDWTTGALVASGSPVAAARSFAFAPDGSRLAVGTSDAKVVVIDTTSWTPTRTLAVPRDPDPTKPPPSWVTSVVWQGNDVVLLTAVYVTAIERWDVGNDQLLPAVPVDLAPTEQPWSLALSPDGTRLAVGTEGPGSTSVGTAASVVVLDWPSARAVTRPFREHFSTVLALAWSRSGKTLVSLADDGRVAVRNADGSPRGEPQAGLVAGVSGLVLLDEQTLVSADGHVVLLAGPPKDPVSATVVSRSSAKPVAFHPDGHLVAIGSADTGLRLLTVPTLEPVSTLAGAGEHGLPMDVAFSPDGSRVAIGGTTDPTDTPLHLDRLGHGWVRVFDVGSGRTVSPVLASASATVLGLDWSPDGTTLLAGDGAGTVSTWDTTTWEPRLDRQPVAGSLAFDLRFVDDGRAVVVSDDGHVRLVDIATGAVMTDKVAVAGNLPLFAVAVSPDRSQLATGGGAGTFVYDAATMAEVGYLPNDGDVVTALAYSPIGGVLATADFSGRTVLWDVAGRQRLGAPLVDAPPHAGFGLAWSPDGTLLAETFTSVDGSGGMAFVRDLDSTALVDAACAKAGRNLTQAEWDRYLPGRPYVRTCPGNPLPLR